MMSLAAAFKKRWDRFDLDIAFQIDEGLTVLFGPSGAGKTTTLRLIAGLLQPDDGRLALNGTILYDPANGIQVAAQHRFFGYVCQNHALFPHMTVLKNIMFGAKDLPKPLRQESARELIATLRLEGLEQKYPQEISGGQQQRVAFARAIIRKPRALLLDEPFSSLDTITRVKMRACLRNIMKDLHIPVIMVTHDIFEACHMADKMLIYSAGRIVQEDTPANIVREPATEEVAALTSFAYFQTLIPNGYPD
jgi:molybdate transport system ATP-binding protein